MQGNTLLALLVSAVGVAALAYTVRRNTAALAPTVLGVLFLVIGLFGHDLWQWSRFAAGAGLPTFFTSEPMAASPAVPAFLFAALGALGSGFLLPRLPRPDRTDSEARETAPGGSDSVGSDSGGLDEAVRDRYMLGLVAVSAFLFCLWCIGEGPSLMRREIYLATDGNEFLLRMTWPASLVVAVLVVVVGYLSSNPTVRIAAMSMSVIWYVSLLSVGTRMSCVFPLILGGLILYRSVAPARRGIERIRPLGIVAAAALVGLAILSFGVILRARGNPHGLLNLGSLLSDTWTMGSGFSEPLKQLVSSVAASYPIVEQSMNVHVDFGVLAGNANPLPGTAQPAELERLWPYEWVPLSFIGTWYEATGPIGQILVFGLMGWCTGQLTYNLGRGRLRSAAYTSVGFAFLLGILSIQYSSRMPWRIFSVVVVLTALAYLLRNRAEVVSRPVGHHQLWQGRRTRVGAQ